MRCEWLDGATGPAVGARFKAINQQGRGPNWSNKPVITVLEPGREIACERTEPVGGTDRVALPLRARGHRHPDAPSRYEVVKPLRLFGWFIIGTLYGLKDRRTDLRNSMLRTLDRLAEMTEGARESAAR